MPLTLAMSVNVSFVVGAVFVPGLWSVVEYLFPVALAAFLAVGIYALRLYGRYLPRIVATGTFDFIANASLIRSPKLRSSPSRHAPSRWIGGGPGWQHRRRPQWMEQREDAPGQRDRSS